MEYKLKKSEFYRIGYLLAGLFMFLFLFGILNLSSFASSFQSSSVIVGVGESYSESYGILDFNYSADDYDIPFTTITTSSSGSGWTRGLNSSLARGSNTIHLVTSDGDFVVNVSQGVADGSNTNHTVTVSGVPQRIYSEFEVYNDTSSSKSVYAVTRVDSISVSDLNGRGSLLNNTGYHSFSPCKVSSPFTFYTGSTDSTRVGDDYCFFFDSYSSTNFSFTGNNATHIFRPSNPNLCVTFSVPFGADASDFKLLFIDDNVQTTYSFSSFSSIGNINIDGGLYTLYQGNFVLDYKQGLGDLIVLSYGSCNVSMPKYYVSIFSYEASITDYMHYVQQNWNDISPSVNNTNQNIAQSVSDIGTAQTFETGAFSDFDTSMTSSGLDTFSLSFSSIPLLWCASIINTFYNNMPSAFQYLLMFVAFVGILFIVLNIAGRVVRRFGGD